jgi:hypothetical protein
MNHLELKDETLEKLSNAFDTINKYYTYDLIKKIYKYKLSHVQLNFTNLQEYDLFFDPWTLEIKKCVNINLIGKKIKLFNDLTYKQFYERNKKYICIAKRNRFNTLCVKNLLTNSIPFFLQHITLENNEYIKLTSRYILKKHKNMIMKPIIEEQFSIEDNKISFINWIFEDNENEFMDLCNHILSCRDNYDEFIIEPGSGGGRKYIGIFLGLFFNKNKVKDNRRELWDKTVIRNNIEWSNIPNDNFVEETNRIFGDYIFQNDSLCETNYKGKIKLIISSDICSASYTLVLFFLLIAGEYTVKNKFITSTENSQIQLIQKTPINRVSKTFTGDSGKGLYLDFDEVKTYRPELDWLNYKDFLLGNFFVGN